MKFRPTTGPLLQTSQRFAIRDSRDVPRNDDYTGSAYNRATFSRYSLCSRRLQQEVLDGRSAPSGADAGRVLQGPCRIGAFALAPARERADLVLSGRPALPLHAARPAHSLF